MACASFSTEEWRVSGPWRVRGKEGDGSARLVEGGAQGKIGRIAFHLERGRLVHCVHGGPGDGRFNEIEDLVGLSRQREGGGSKEGRALSAYPGTHWA